MSIIAGLCVLIAAAQAPSLPTREFRSVWIATVDNIDWPSKRGLSTEAQQAELRAIFDKAQELNLNAIVFQIRPSTDALYDSKIEPWSEYLTGQQGKAPSPYWDPLQWAVDEAHKRGMELHTWFNPYRAWHPAAKGEPAKNWVGVTHPNETKKYGRYYWLDPGEKFVQDRSIAVMMDVVRRYDVDGIHIDDYFYPYKSYADNADFPDDASWRKYQAGGGKLSRGDWRRKNVDDFIQRLYGEIKAEKRWVKFGISPFGIYRPGYPPEVKAGMDQYDSLYADARKWLVEGWCDYYTPQLYWKVKSDQAYPALLNWWTHKDQNPKGRHLWPGNFTGRTNPKDGNWPASEVVEQIEVTRKNPKSTGNVHFSMKAFTNNFSGISTALKSGPYARPALIPPSPWLDDRAPDAPVLVSSARRNGVWRVTVKPGSAEAIRFYVFMAKRGGNWSVAKVSSEPTADLPGDATGAAVYALDRVSNASEALMVSGR